MTDLKDGDLAIIRFKDGGAETLACFNTDRHDPMYQAAGMEDVEPVESWSFFGSDLDARVDEVEVVRQMYLTTEKVAKWAT